MIDIICRIDDFDAECKEAEHTDDEWGVLNDIRRLAMTALRRERLLAVAIERLQEWVRPPDDDGRDAEYTADVELAAGLLAEAVGFELVPDTEGDYHFCLVAGDVVLVRIRVHAVFEKCPKCCGQAEMGIAPGFVSCYHCGYDGRADASNAVVMDFACPLDEGNTVWMSVSAAGQLLDDFGVDPGSLYHIAQEQGWEVK